MTTLRVSDIIVLELYIYDMKCTTETLHHKMNSDYTDIRARKVGDNYCAYAGMRNKTMTRIVICLRIFKVLDERISAVMSLKN